MNSGAPEFNPYASQTNYLDDEYDDGYAEATVGGYYDTGNQMDETTVSDGSYYPTYTEPYMPHIQSAPISALAIDPVADAIYIAGHTVSLARKRHYAGYPSSSTDQRASMLATHVFSDGTLYSACAAHAEARKEVLDNIATSIYRNAFTSVEKTLMKIPNHAYRPPYDPVALSQDVPFMKKIHHIGVTKILPFTSNVASNNSESTGYHCTVSPSAVRVHTRGGLQVSESKMEGMVSGTFHPGMYQSGVDDKMISSSATHVTVGGVSTDRTGNNLHCMDLYSSSLKAVASHAVRSDNGYSKMCISDLATSHEKTNIIAGCSDGTLRIFDGSWRGGNYMECAKIQAHGGGVAHIATAGNLICTTGFSSRSPVNYSGGSGASGGSSLYAFPDEHVLVFDIRYLGRGGIAHPFSGLKGGPRLLSFIPGVNGSSEHRIVACSGQPGGGVQIITPFDSLSGNITGSDDYFTPLTDPGEFMTAISVVGKNMAIGTSFSGTIFGNVIQYRMAGYEQVVSKFLSTGKVENKLSDERLAAPSCLEAPPLSIDPHLLQGSVSHEAASISVFNPYVMRAEPMLTPTTVNGERNPYSFGPLSNTFRPAGKRMLSNKLEELISSAKPDDYLTSIETSKLDLNLFNNNSKFKSNRDPMNPNKLVHGGSQLANICYDADADPRKKDRKGANRDSVSSLVYDP